MLLACARQVIGLNLGQIQDSYGFCVVVTQFIHENGVI
jgi:hypothetical protein